MAKWLSEEALQLAEKRKDLKGKGEKERYNHLNAEFQRIAGEIRKPSSMINAKKQKKTIEWERVEISSRKLEIARELEKVSFHSNPKERQCQRMLKLLHSCTHLTH